MVSITSDCEDIYSIRIHNIKIFALKDYISRLEKEIKALKEADMKADIYLIYSFDLDLAKNELKTMTSTKYLVSRLKHSLKTLSLYKEKSCEVKCAIETTERDLEKVDSVFKVISAMEK